MDASAAQQNENLKVEIENLNPRFQLIDGEVKAVQARLAAAEEALKLKLGISRFEQELELKFSRNEFLSFVDKNQFSIDKIKEIDSKIDKLTSEITLKLDALESFARKSKKVFNKRCDDQEKQIEKIESFNTETKQKSHEKEMRLNTVCESMKFLERRIEDLKKNVVEVFTQRLNCLATTKSQSCLSCGKKDVNFAPETQYLRGIAHHCYVKDQQANIDATQSQPASQAKALANPEPVSNITESQRRQEDNGVKVSTVTVETHNKQFGSKPANLL